MNARGFTLRLSIRSSCAVLCALLLAVPAAAQMYGYSDGFSTDKLLTDSWYHSAVLDTTPDPWPEDGFLMYEKESDDRMLRFYYGLAHDAYAWVKYRFPLEATGEVYSSATVGLSLVHNWYGDGFLRCYCSLEGGSVWEWPSCSEEGHCTFDFFGPAADTISIWFMGLDATIDDLTVELGSGTAADRGSWGRIKSLFRHPVDDAVNRAPAAGRSGETHPAAKRP